MAGPRTVPAIIDSIGIPPRLAPRRPTATHLAPARMSPDDRPRLGPGRRSRSPGAPGLLSRIAGIALGTVVLAASLLVSAIVFAVLLVVAVVAGGYLWWRTRDLRRQVREQRAAAAEGRSPPGPSRPGRPGAPDTGDGPVIDGDYIREVDPPRGPAPPCGGPSST
jgi:hypothetical protein